MILLLAKVIFQFSFKIVPRKEERFVLQRYSRIHSESLLRLADSLQPACHLCALTIEVVGSVPVRSWLRDLNHQITAKSTFASKADEVGLVVISEQFP